jgi:hypothetical protein
MKTSILRKGKILHKAMPVILGLVARKRMGSGNPAI